MGFMEQFNRVIGYRLEKKTMAERYPSASPAFLQFSAFKEGRVGLEELSDEALILVYKDKMNTYDIEVKKYNSLRKKSSDDLYKNTRSTDIDEQDERTANTRQNLNIVLAEMRNRGLSEDQPELKQDGIF